MQPSSSCSGHETIVGKCEDKKLKRMDCLWRFCELGICDLQQFEVGKQAWGLVLFVSSDDKSMQVNKVGKGLPGGVFCFCVKVWANERSRIADGG